MIRSAALLARRCAVRGFAPPTTVNVNLHVASDLTTQLGATHDDLVRRVDKLVDVVGLYLDPPDKAVVLCMDEKSQMRALDRTQPSPPMNKGRAGTITHDYKRNGTSTLFAVLDVATGKIIGQCLPRGVPQVLGHHRPWGPQDLQVHLILDNYATHKHADVAKVRRGRVTLETIAG